MVPCSGSSDATSSTNPPRIEPTATESMLEQWVLPSELPALLAGHTPTPMEAAPEAAPLIEVEAPATHDEPSWPDTADSSAQPFAGTTPRFTCLDTVEPRSTRR